MIEALLPRISRSADGATRSERTAWLASAKSLAQESAMLTTEVTKFLETVRAA
jgi:hypothetical protein